MRRAACLCLFRHAQQPPELPATETAGMKESCLRRPQPARESRDVGSFGRVSRDEGRRMGVTAVEQERRQIRAVDYIRGRRQRQSLHDVLQLAHVARPAIALHRSQGTGLVRRVATSPTSPVPRSVTAVGSGTGPPGNPGSVAASDVAASAMMMLPFTTPPNGLKGAAVNVMWIASTKSSGNGKEGLALRTTLTPPLLNSVVLEAGFRANVPKLVPSTVRLAPASVVMWVRPMDPPVSSDSAVASMSPLVKDVPMRGRLKANLPIDASANAVPGPPGAKVAVAVDVSASAVNTGTNGGSDKLKMELVAEPAGPAADTRFNGPVTIDIGPNPGCVMVRLMSRSKA